MESFVFGVAVGGDVAVKTFDTAFTCASSLVVVVAFKIVFLVVAQFNGIIIATLVSVCCCVRINNAGVFVSAAVSSTASHMPPLPPPPLLSLKVEWFCAFFITVSTSLLAFRTDRCEMDCVDWCGRALEGSK